MEIFFESLAIILVFEFILFVFAYFTERNDLADFGWGIGFGLLAVYNYFENPSPDFFQKLLLFLILVWAFRLAGYIGYRLKGKAEDQRYTDMRDGWKDKKILKTFFYVFFLQGFLLWIFAIPLIWYMSSSELVWSHLTWIAFAISVFGLIFETMADAQKSAFKKKNHDSESFIQSGVFKYSRYPQYFGEITFWFGVALFPMSLGPTLTMLYAPVALALMILKVSGVPLLEKKYVQRKGYPEYAARTPLLIPKFFKFN